MKPCWRCMNCRNGAATLCLNQQPDKPEPPVRTCPCGAALWGKRRFCGTCRADRRTAQTREAVRKSRGVSKNRNSTPVNIGPKRGENRVLA